MGFEEILLLPYNKLKNTWKYCSYNKPFFLFILLLLFTLNIIPNIFSNIPTIVVLYVVIFIISSGYGMCITRDKINHGHRLPKIMPKLIITLGIKSSIVFIIYFSLQSLILNIFSDLLNFPQFDLIALIMHFSDTLRMLFTHNFIHSLIFFTVGAILFYVTTFFTSIGLAKLADTGSLSTAFNLKSIYKIIGLFGWKKYISEYNFFIITLVILTYLQSLSISNFWIDNIIDTFFEFLIFASVYMGMGDRYGRMKDIEKNTQINQKNKIVGK